jgi:hypothetical protein
MGPRRRPSSASDFKLRHYPSDVKFGQILSSFAKALLGGALCNFNDLPETSLTAALQRELGRPTPL